MSKERLNKEELELLGTEQGAYAVVLGYLKQVNNKISTPQFNKIVQELGYAKMKRPQLAAFAYDMQEENGVLYSLYRAAFDRKIKLDDIPDAIGEDKGLEEKNVFDLLSPQLLMKEKHSMDMKEFRKLQKEAVLYKMMFDEFTKEVKNEFKGLPQPKYLVSEPIKPTKGDRSAVLICSDWHIGFVNWHESSGAYNYDRLKLSIQDIINYTQKMIAEQNIKHLYVVHLGDICENSYLRPSQQMELEYSFSQQTTKATRMLVDMLSILSKQVHVTFAMCSGNHDRGHGSKDTTIPNDSSTYIILDTLLMIQSELNQLRNVTVIDNRDYVYSFMLEIAGKWFKGVHGDFENRKGTKIPKHIKDEREITYLLSGHLHSFSIDQEDYDRLAIQTGSAFGANTYSKKLNLPDTLASQTLMVVEEGSSSPWIIPLMLNKEGRLK
jgi:predicted phosphodiesterase